MSSRRWPIALALALALHLGFFAGLDLRPAATGARAEGQGGLLVSLASPGGGAGNPDAATGTVQPSEPPPVEPDPTPKPEPRPEAEPEPEPKRDPRVVELEQSEPDPEPEPDAQAEAEPEPEPESVRRAGPEDPAEEQVAGQQARAGAGAGTEAATTAGEAGGGNPGARIDYLARIQALLARHREYPRRARLRRIEGTVEVSFTLHPDGRITGTRISRSSGHAVLDRAARELLARAGPLPPFPRDMEPTPFALQLPIEYSLR